MSPSQRHNGTWSSSLGLEKLPHVSPPTFPRFTEMVEPRTFELIQQDKPAIRPREQSLFEALLGSDVTTLHHDATEHPEKYDQRAVHLIDQLVAGARTLRDLEEADRRLLDHATIDFSSYMKPATIPTRTESASSMQKTAMVEDDDDGGESSPIAGVDVPETDTPAYWWL